MSNGTVDKMKGRAKEAALVAGCSWFEYRRHAAAQATKVAATWRRIQLEKRVLIMK